MSEQVVYEDAPVAVAAKPIERKHGVTFIGGTTVRTRDVWESHMAVLAQEPPGTRLRCYAGLTEEQTQYAIRYEAKRAKRKDPVARKLKANGRACKKRGYDFEKWIEARLAPFGFKRTIMSGALGGTMSGDLRRERLERVKACVRCLEGSDVVEPAMLIECKRQEAEQRFFRNALAQGGGSHAVIVGKKGIEPLVVMELAAFEALLRQADYEVTR